jgi:hypothetical protein
VAIGFDVINYLSSLGLLRPANILSNVDFPVPLAPTIVNYPPSKIVKDKDCKI